MLIGDSDDCAHCDCVYSTVALPLEEKQVHKDDHFLMHFRMLAIQLALLFLVSGANISQFPGQIYRAVVSQPLAEASLVSTVVGQVTDRLPWWPVSFALQGTALLWLALCWLMLSLLVCNACFVVREFYK